jgi:O-glycosyl hydrolase
VPVISGVSGYLVWRIRKDREAAEKKTTKKKKK